MYKLSHALNNGHKVNEEKELGNVPKLKCRRSNRKRKEELELNLLAISSKLKCLFSLVSCDMWEREFISLI
jgi:hypothetical protein